MFRLFLSFHSLYPLSFHLTPPPLLFPGHRPPVSFCLSNLSPRYSIPSCQLSETFSLQVRPSCMKSIHKVTTCFAGTIIRVNRGPQMECSVLGAKTSRVSMFCLPKETLFPKLCSPQSFATEKPPPQTSRFNEASPFCLEIVGQKNTIGSDRQQF